MSDVELYTREWCGYCHRAKRLLDRMGVTFREYDLASDPDLESEMIERSGGGYTVPQIFIDGVHVGGSDELAALAASGKLQALLSPAAQGGGDREDT